MHGTELMLTVSRRFGQRLEGLVLRRFVAGQALVHRVSPEEQIDLDTYSDVVALVPVSLEEIRAGLETLHQNPTLASFR